MQIPLSAQSVHMGKDINMRSNAQYDLVGTFGGNITIIEDMGRSMTIHQFQDDLTSTPTIDILPRTKKGVIRGYVPMDSLLCVYFIDQDSGKYMLSVAHYDVLGQEKDRTVIYETANNTLSDNSDPEVDLPKGSFTMGPLIVSEDKKQHLVRLSLPGKVRLYMNYDVSLKKVTWTQRLMDTSILPSEMNRKSHVLSNSGNYYAVYLKEKDRKKNDFVFLHVGPNQLLTYPYTPNDIFINSIQLEIDNIKPAIYAVGFYNTSGNESIQEGIWTSNLDASSLQLGPINTIPFLTKTIHDFHGKSENIKAYLFDLELKQVLFREDGGFILLGEQRKEISRINNTGRNAFLPMSTSTDYYLEDVIVSCIAPNGNMEWQKVLQKKQHSYDDDAAFSSYYIHENASSIRLLYNDEIRSQNTISEYVINPMGKIERRVLLNTADRNIHLQLKNAVQINANAAVLPSVTKSKLKLVKIQY